jgi:hypothetical protein
MRLPAVAVAAAFACGIAVGLHPVVAKDISSKTLLISFLVFAVMFLLVGIILVKQGRLYFESIASLLCLMMMKLASISISDHHRSSTQLT